MKRFFLLTALVGQSAISATSQVPRWTVDPYLGVKNVAWETGKPSLPQPFGPTPITQESGILPNVGAALKYRLSDKYAVKFRGDFFRGNTKLDGEYATFVGVDQPTIASVTDQKVRWSGWSLEGAIQRSLSLSTSFSLSPQVSLAYQSWNQLPPTVENPLVVVYQSNFEWLRAGIGAELEFLIGEKQKIYFSPELRVPISFRNQALNFRTSDNFNRMRDNIAKQGSPEPIGPEGAERVITSLWPKESNKGKPNSKLGYAAEIGWVGNWLTLSLIIESLNVERLVWYPYANASGTFTTIRVGVPIRKKEQKPQPGYFRPSSTPRK